MALIILQELKAYGANVKPPFNSCDLISKFKLEEDPILFTKIISELNNTTFLKHRKPKIRIVDLSTVEYEEESIPGELINKETFQFTFVGMIKIMGLTIIIYPKYIETIDDDVSNKFRKFKQLLKVIAKYDKREKQNLMISKGELIEKENKLGAAIQLLDYYSEYGLYTVEQNLLEEGGSGCINWEKTINEVPITFSGRSPIYLAPYTEMTNVDEFHKIRMIQLAVLTDFKSIFGDILFLLDYNLPQERDMSLNDIGDIDTLIYYLDRELNTQYVSHKIELIKLLKLYLMFFKREESKSDITLYGVTKFDRVWEDVCKKVYGDDLERTLSNIGLKEKLGCKSTTLLKNVVERPIWVDEQTKKEYRSDKSLELDVLHVNEKESIFEIYDAKYYMVRFDEKHIKGQPGIGDVTKQYLYELTYKELANVNNYKISNAFIIPKDELKEDKGDGVLFSKVTLPIFKNMGLKSIKVIARDCEVIFEEYLL